MPEINAICNRVLIINQGRVVLDERPEHLGRTMGETFEVSLEVKGPRERILTELRSLPSVGEVKVVDAAASVAPTSAPAESTEDEAATPTDAPVESVKLLVTSADRAEDIREALFFGLAGAGYPILEMKRESLSLEDIFLKLTTDEPADTSKEEVDTDA